METFLYVALESSDADFSADEEMDVIDDAVDKLLEYLVRKYKIKIWRPMWLCDENDEEFLSEYPYNGELDFDDDETFLAE